MLFEAPDLHGPPLDLDTLAGSGARVLLVPRIGEPAMAWQLPWVGMRSLVAGLVRARGVDVVRAALWPDRVALSLVLRGLAELDAEQLAMRDRITPQLAGFMSHNGMLAMHLRLAWLSALARLLPDTTLILPEPHEWDPRSLEVLLTSMLETRSFRVVVGACPSGSDTPAERLHRRDVAQVLERARLAAKRDAKRIAGTLPHAKPTEPCAAFDDALELRAWADPDALALNLDAITAAFSCFGFACAERLAARMLTGDHMLTPAQRRHLHRVVALAAYNQQVRTRAGNGTDADADQALAEHLDHHFHAALEGEDAPAWRAHLHYRLCINEGRRRAHLATALAHAEQAVEIAETMQLQLEHAWALNGRAYVRARMGDIAAAIADSKAAVEVLAEPCARLASAERLPTHVVLADNLATLELLAGNDAQAEHWDRRKQALVALLPGRNLSSFRGIEIATRNHRLRDALALAHTMLEQARELFDPYAEDRALAELAVLHYRRGDARAAFEAASLALTTLQQTQAHAELDEADRLGATELCAAMAALRSADSRAIELLSDALETTDDVAAQAELRACLGWAWAIHGHAEASEVAINEAIELAVSLGAAETMTRVACTAAAACLALGRLDDAAQAHAQALELSPECSASDRVIACAGWLRTHPPEPEIVDEALALLDDALREPEVWWELPTLAAALALLGRPSDDRLDALLAERCSPA